MELISLSRVSSRLASVREWTYIWAGALATARSLALLWLCLAWSDRPMVKILMPLLLASAAAEMTSGFLGWSRPSVKSSATLTLSGVVSWAKSCVVLVMA